MAALSVTKLGGRRPKGAYFEETYSASISSQSATDEWIDTGGQEVASAVGFATTGTSGATANLSVIRNASGTGATEGANPGHVGVETADAAATVYLTVTYR